MYKKIALLVEFVSLLILVECAFAQDLYHDGNYSNGEYITVQCGDLTDVVFIEGGVIDFDLNLEECSLKMNVTKVKINTSFLSTELQIDRTKLAHFGFIFEKDGREIFFIGGVKILINVTKASSILISENNLTISVDKEMILESTLPESFKFFWVDMVNGNITRISSEYLTFDELNFFRLKTSTGNKSMIFLPSRCPTLYLDEGGTFIADKTLFMIKPKKHLTIEEFNFKTKEKVIFEAVEGRGCITRLNATGVPFKFIERMEGKFFSLGYDLKIVDGKIEIDGTILEGKDIYFWTDLYKFKEFNKDSELKKKASGVCFDESTKTLLLSDNANLSITVNGQEVEFIDGKPRNVTPNFPKIYEVQRDWEEELSELISKIYLKKDATCEEFGGKWVKEKECSEGWLIGCETNTYTGAKILDYKEGKVCCVEKPKEIISKVRVINKIEYKIIDASSDIVGRTIFTTPKGTVIIDIASQFLKRDLEKVKKEVFVKEIYNLIPSEIRVTDLMGPPLPFSICGKYYRPKSWWQKYLLREKPKIKIERVGLGRSSIIVHEILHHFYYTMSSRPSLIKKAMDNYLEDKNLDEKEKETRQRLIDWLKSWESLYMVSRSSYRQYFERITCNEGHSVIGQWLYEEFLDLREDVKFPPYVLELYEGILRPEIIEKGRS